VKSRYAVSVYQLPPCRRGGRQALRVMRRRHRCTLPRDGRAERPARRRGDHHGAFLDQHLGASVVFVDTDASTFTIDPAAIEAAITPRTVGIIPVQLYGQPANMDAIWRSRIARRRIWRATRTGRSAPLASRRPYSFYSGKNLGAMGDAGAVVSNDGALAERMMMLARHGGLTKHRHQIEGINSRLDGLQAAILSAKLPHLADWTKGRRDAAKVYDAGFNQVGMSWCPQSGPTAPTSIISIR
jgi:dTDP-4-amino-4,6-dideoxygalactose transaminase